MARILDGYRHERTGLLRRGYGLGPAPLVFSSGFETGDFSQFHTVDAAATIVTAPVAEGTYAAAVPAGSFGFRMGGAWNLDEVRASFWLRIDRDIAVAQYDSTIANVEDSVGADITYLRARHYTDGRIGLIFRKVSGGPAADLAGEHFISAGQWYRIGLRLLIGTGTGALGLFVDGVLAISHEGIDLGTVTIDQFMLYNSSTGSPRTSYFDGIVIDSPPYAT